MSQTFQISNGDIIVSSANGRPILIADRPKLSQDIQEFFTVAVQPSGFGAGIEQLIGIVEINPDVFVSLADSHIQEGINTFIQLQNSNLTIPRSLAEQLQGLTNLQVSSDPQDPTKFYFRVNINTQAGIQVPLTTPVVGQS